MAENIYDTVIIGSGPAGLTAAIYNVRADLKTVVLSGSVPGGQLTITTKVDNWPGFPNGVGGIKLMMDMQQQVRNLGVEIKVANVKKINLSGKNFSIELENGESIKTKAVVVTTGARAKWLGLPKEEVLIGRGISGCATCDGMFFRDKVVAVVGGGNVAMEDASFLSKICKKVYIIHRRDTFRADPAEAKMVLNDDKIEKIWNSEVIEINSNDQTISIPNNDQLHNIKIVNNQTKDTKILPIDGLFVAIGRTPSTEFLKGLVELKENGYVVVGKNEKWPMMTSREGIFAAGDCMDENYRQAIVAAGAGCKAAKDAEKWLKETGN